MKQENEKYCTECGQAINIKAEICPKCGVRQPIILENTPAPQPLVPVKENRYLISILLYWFLGVFGAHRFYLGHTGTGVAMLLTFGGCGVWALVDLIVIAMGNFRDAEGNLVKNS